MGQIADRVASARSGENPLVIARLRSAWAVMGAVQFLPGYCLLLADPVVSSLNDLTGAARRAYLEDMGCLGDAVLEVTRAKRINYEILGNLEPELHAHVFPRFEHEPEDQRLLPVWFYDWKNAEPYAETKHGALRKAIRDALGDAVYDPRQ